MVISGPFQSASRAIPEPFESHSRVISGSFPEPFQSHSRAIPVPLQCHLSVIPVPSHGMALGWHWDDTAVPFQYHPCVIPVPSQCHPSAIPAPYQCHIIKPFPESFQRHSLNIFFTCTIGQDEGPDQGSMPDVVIFAESTEHVSEVIFPT
jgi:hypothetical protein